MPVSVAATTATPEFVPPYPDRPTSRLHPLELLRRLRGNLIAVWHDRHFEEAVFATRVLGRRILVCNGPASVAAAFLDHAAALERKTPQMRRALRPLVGQGLIVSDGALWRQRRRLIAPATHGARLPALAPAMTAAASARRDAWTARPGATVDMLAEMGSLAADIVARAIFGRPLDPADATAVAAAFATYQRRGQAGDLLALLGEPDWLPPRLGATRATALRIMRDVLDRAIATARPDGLPATLGAAGLDPVGIREEVATLFLAGQETTATTLGWAWYLLHAAPDVAARLRAEANAVLGGRAAGWNDLPALPLARAVVEETLRLYPPIPLLAREVGVATTIAGHAVRRGDLLLVVPWLLHRHRLLWPAPDTFRPDRFLPGAPRPPRHAYLPFGLGPRVCTGAAFAMAETVTVLATLAPHVAPALVPGTAVFPVCRLTLRPGETLPMRLLPA